MRIRSLDGTHDFEFGKGIQSYVFDSNAVGENVKTRLLEFINDCWFNMRAGLPWTHLLGDLNTRLELEADCRAVILQTPGVVKINNFEIIISDSRGCTISLDIDTIYSQNYNLETEVTL